MLKLEQEIRVVRRATERAVQVVLAEWPFKILWLPRSQIQPSDLRAGERDIIIKLTRWIAEQKDKEMSEGSR